jgi:phosphatidylinositol glycan class B
MRASEIAIRGFREASGSLRLFLTAPGAEGTLNRGFAILAAVTVVTAWFSETFFFPDEHFQILEYMAMRLGLTSPADLPWEFGAQARPFTQAFLYYLIAVPLRALGLKDLFDLMAVLRLVTGIVSLTALFAFAKQFSQQLERDDEKRAFARMLPFMGFLPYLFVRTASETASCAFFTLALVLTLRGGGRRMLAAGLLAGLAFECRYQSAFLTLGLMAWLVVIARQGWRPMLTFIAGGLAAVIAALFIDRWGYGVWCFPPWNYFDVNLIQGVASKTFGSSPFFAYFYLEPGTIFAPITAVLLIAGVVAAIRAPSHVVTWATVPFFLVHCFMAHKEERFLFPLAILATAWPVLAFSGTKVWRWRTSWAAKAVGWSAVAAMLFLAVYPFGIRPHMKMAKYLYRTFPAGLHAYSFDTERFDSYPMVQPKPYRVDILFDTQDLQTALAKGPVYLFSNTPTLPVALPPGVGARLQYSEFVLARSNAAAATRIMCAAADLKREGPIHPPKLTFLTLFRVERGIANDAAPSPCIPRWSKR